MVFRSVVCAALLVSAVPALAQEGTGAARDWRAWIERAPGGGRRLHVEGRVRAAATATPRLSADRLQGINPAILFLDLAVPFGVGAKRFKPVGFGRAADRTGVAEVDVFLDGAMIARIPVKGK